MACYIIEAEVVILSTNMWFIKAWYSSCAELKTAVRIRVYANYGSVVLALGALVTIAY